MKSETILEISKKFAKEIIGGLNESVTPYHAVDYCRRKLVDNGFLELSERLTNKTKTKLYLINKKEFLLKKKNLSCINE